MFWPKMGGGRHGSGQCIPSANRAGSRIIGSPGSAGVIDGPPEQGLTLAAATISQPAGNVRNLERSHHSAAGRLAKIAASSASSAEPVGNLRCKVSVVTLIGPARRAD